MTKSARNGAYTFWLTGLSGAGKSTLAIALQTVLQGQGKPVSVLDGDVLRGGLCSDLGFSQAGRSENIRRVSEVARLINDAGITVVAALISPFEADRVRARERIGANRFIEVHVSTDLSVCEQRDVKGLYRRARAGELADFTGVSSPYEAPLKPDLVLDLGRLSVNDAVLACLDKVRAPAGDAE
ncbi:MAG: adenylyl-sulfate kinase [Rhodocyclaceae bacterium]